MAGRGLKRRAVTAMPEEHGHAEDITRQATDPADLEPIAADPGWVQEAEAEAWGGRGPSASYAEWLAEGDDERVEP